MFFRKELCSFLPDNFEMFVNVLLYRIKQDALYLIDWKSKKFTIMIFRYRNILWKLTWYIVLMNQFTVSNNFFIVLKKKIYSVVFRRGRKRAHSRLVITTSITLTSIRFNMHSIIDQGRITANLIGGVIPYRSLIYSNSDFCSSSFQLKH